MMGIKFIFVFYNILFQIFVGKRSGSTTGGLFCKQLPAAKGDALDGNDLIFTCVSIWYKAILWWVPAHESRCMKRKALDVNNQI